MRKMIMVGIGDVSLERIAEYAIGFCPETGPVDWDDLIYRVEDAFGFDLGTSMLDPRIVAIKRAVNAARRAARD